MAGLSHEAIAARRGTAFQVVLTGGEPVSLTLRSVDPLSDSGRPGGSFRLEFVGPAAPYLPQGIYRFAAGDDEPIEIFIVPIASEAAGLIYEAVFY